LGLSRVGRSASVSRMPLKGSSEARGKPPKCCAWLRDRMLSSDEAGLDLRGMPPLSQYLARWDSQWRVSFPHRGSSRTRSYPKDDMGNLMYPMSTEEPRYAGTGLVDNRHLHDPVESIRMNVGDPSGDGKESGSRGMETRLENLRCVGRESAWP
jgi:hypothetical protein